MSDMPPYAQTKADMAGMLAKLGLKDMSGFRLMADTIVAEHVAAGWPRAMAGAVALTGLLAALRERPEIINMRYQESLEMIRTGKVDAVTIDLKLALAILIDSFSPEADVSEWDDGPGR